MEEWKTINPDEWKPEQENENISGLVVNKEDATKELSARYSLDTGQGLKLAWGSAVLDQRMKYVNVGDFVRITYLGKGKNKKGQDMKLYKVEVRQQGQAE